MSLKNFLCYTYDESFIGLLTCVYEAYYRKEIPDEICKKDSLVSSFLYTYVDIKSDEDKFKKVYDALIEKISKAFLQKLYFAFLSEAEGREILIYKYIRLGFKLKNDIEYNLHNEVVIEVNKLSKKVWYEKHRMLGFLRFKAIEKNVYYAPMEPDHNILELITPHFVHRFQCENFIIHDVKRELASLYNGSEWIVVYLNKEEGKRLENSLDEGIYEKLWKEYFKSTAIKNRKNERLQKNYMPKRYWKYMLETEE
ncbi:TIGR03915 family putative DNA repair protein [Haloimpatiens sp. FM7315]|uniref:TIGR03915 family putative DNA repair protein n=1 Tax=Haloimpatiens sp. FM7315 TaxID=3298609 RepID=UPI00370B3AB5